MKKTLKKQSNLRQSTMELYACTCECVAGSCSCASSPRDFVRVSDSASGRNIASINASLTY
ncbi:MAG: hypothetical protein Q4F83_10025 [Eubacteriales bacterium]|nr:hypothetical protein [Eubacteriales bacterium]